MPATLAPPPTKSPTPTTPTVSPASDKPTKIDAPSGNEPSPDSYLGDDMAELSAMDESGSREAPQRGPDGKFQKPTEAPKKPQDKPEPQKATETPKEPEKPVEEERPNNVRGLGKLLDEKNRVINKELQPKIQSLEAKTKEYERTIEDLRKAQPDLKPFQERVSALEAQNKQLLEAIRFADYKKSPEFVEKYEKPYNEAWTKAVSEVTQLTLTMEDGTTRKATTNDLLALANAPLDQLDDLAAQWFPKSAPRVIRHVEKIRDLAESQDKALQEAQKGAGEFHTKQTEAAKAANLAFTQAYEGANTELTKKYPKWFAPDEADPKGNELLQKGYQYADSVFSANGNLTPEQKAGRLAVVRAKAANHDRLVTRLKARDAQIAELEAKLAEFEKSEPPTDGGGNPSEITGPRDFEADDLAELRKLDR